MGVEGGGERGVGGDKGEGGGEGVGHLGEDSEVLEGTREVVFRRFFLFSWREGENEEGKKGLGMGGAVGASNQKKKKKTSLFFLILILHQLNTYFHSFLQHSHQPIPKLDNSKTALKNQQLQTTGHVVGEFFELFFFVVGLFVLSIIKKGTRHFSSQK